MDTASLPLTTTTSPTGVWTQTEKSIETEAVNPLVWVVISSVVTSALIAWVTAYSIINRLDGQRWIGWTYQMVNMNGKDRRVMVPMYMTAADLKSLQEGK